MVNARIIPALTLALFFLLLTSALAAAHGPGEESSTSVEDIAESTGGGNGSKISTLDVAPLLKQRALWVITGASFIVALLTFAALSLRPKDERTKWMLFLGIAVPIVFATLFSAGTTIYLNQISHTKGPVHWHADFEIWNCGEKVDLQDPVGLSNRVGNPVLHEHGDGRIHVEGVVVSQEDVSLHHFFEQAGGEMSKEALLLPTNSGNVNMRNGALCRGKPAQLQVFVYSVVNPDERSNWILRQEKIDIFPEYVLARYANIPPGDCFIVEFDVEKEKTDKLCASYEAALARGDIQYSKNSEKISGGEQHGR